MLALLYLLVVGAIGVFFIGYLTPKVALWGSIGTGMMWMTAHLIPTFSPDEVLNTVGPHILNLFFVYPRAMGLAFDARTAADGFLGGIAVIVIGILWLIPYLVGLYLGIATWPELFIFRVVL